MTIREHYVCGIDSQPLTYRAYDKGISLASLKSRRSRLELLITVLQAIKSGKAKPTRIMYEANLSWTLLKDVLSSLETQDLVEGIDASESGDKRTSKIYKITEKGEHLIKYFHNAEQLLKLN